VEIGDSRSVVHRYLSFDSSDLAKILEGCLRIGTGTARLRNVVVSEDGAGLSPITGAPVRISITLENTTSSTLRNIDIGISLHERSEAGLAIIYSSFFGKSFDLPPGDSKFSFVMRSPMLASGQYFLGFRICDQLGEELDNPQTLLPFDVAEFDYYRSGRTGWRDWGASVLMEGDWQDS
jgi:hypothetical protein